MQSIIIIIMACLHFFNCIKYLTESEIKNKVRYVLNME